MGQQTSVAYTFCCTACSACPCCSRSEYDQMNDKLGLINNNGGLNYSSNGMYINNNIDNIDNKNEEKTKFRAFIIAYNKNYGYLLLRAYKKGKGLHYQLPGGHIDKYELHGRSFEEAAKMAAKRELFEETGLNITDDQRLKFLKLGIKYRMYFQLLLKEEDSLNDTNVKSLNEKQNFYLNLSAEHNGFEFEKDIDSAIKMIEKHSGGKNSDALKVYALKAKHERKYSRTRSHSHSHSHSNSKKHKKKKKKQEKKKEKKIKKKLDQISTY